MKIKLRNRLLFLLTEREREEGRRITQLELAATLEVSNQTIGRWLRNDIERFDAPVIEKLCAYFNCEVGDLLYIEHDHKEK